MPDDTLIYRGADEMVRKLEDLAHRAPAAQGQMLFHAGEALRSFMVENYLSGQRLRRRTGRLASGWTTHLQGSDTAVVGTRVIYARVHEQGSHDEVQVREHQRRPPVFRRGGESARAFSARRTATQLSFPQGPGAGTVTVRAHSMRMNVIAKWYARDTVRFGAPVALRAAENALQKYLGGQSGN